jgi:hypothetical protein
MKTILLSAAICMLFFLQSYSQNKNTSGFIAKGSFNIGNVMSTANNTSSKAKIRFGYGVAMEYLKNIDKNGRVYISAMTALQSRGYQNVRAMYFDVPVTLNYAVGKNKRILLGGGLYAGVALSGSYKNSTDTWTKMNFGETAADNRSKTDYGYKLSYTAVSRYFGMVFNIDYLGGLKNVIPSERQANGNSLKLRTTVISVGIPLVKK